MNEQSTTQQAWLVSMNIGKQSFQQGRMSDAVNAFSQATKLQPRRVEGWVNFGSALIETGRIDASVLALDNAITLNPKLMAPHMLLGDALRQLGEFNLALTSYRQAVALQRNPLALNKLACALRVVGQVEEARELYLEATRLDPGFTLARVNMATLQIECGQFEEAGAQLSALASRSLSPVEREEVTSSQRALSEYFRLNEVLTRLNTQQNTAPLKAELENSPAWAVSVDQAAMTNLHRYIESANRLFDTTESVAGAPPQEWPLIEALFMIPLVNSVGEYQAIKAEREQGLQPSSELLQSVNMEPAILAARTCEQEMDDPVKAELHLRHWHALACRDVAGFMPGHFKYTQNWSTRSPTLKRVEPALASATFRRYITEVHANLKPGLVRAAFVFIAVCDLHPFADGNGRVAMIWLNRELEWAGLMPALFRRDLGLKGELGDAQRDVRINGGDLTPLIAAITRAQHYALEFCAALRATNSTGEYR